ncbi:MAG: hypothetical protein JEZ08_00595 [Clostridiales bacterium]|nr:hypothetical protein [Clostridiales bacterium]
MKQVSIIALLLLSHLFLVSCGSETTLLEYKNIDYSTNQTLETDIVKTSVEAINFKNAQASFSERRDLNHLDNLEVFWSDDILNLSFYFDDQAELDDIQKAMDFYSSIVLSDHLEEDEFAYQIHELIQPVDENKSHLRIYYDDILLLKTYHEFNENYILLENDFFENNLMTMPIKDTFKLSKAVSDKIKSKSGIKSIRLIKAIKPFTLYVHVYIDDYNSSEFESVLKSFEQEFESEYVLEDIKMYDNEATSFVVTYLDGDKVLKERQLSNKSLEKKWQDFYWQTD